MGILRGGPIAASENISGTIAKRVRDAILNGRLEPGQRIKEGQIAQELGVSRTPVREALMLLKSEGLVEVLPNRGARVRAYEADDLYEIYELRSVLESFAARKAAENISERDIEALKASCAKFNRLCKEGDVRGLIKENLFFHETIMNAAGNSRLTELIRGVVELPLVYKIYHWSSPEERLASGEEHLEVAKALEVRDPELAEKLMRKHLVRRTEFLLRQLKAHQIGASGDDFADIAGTLVS